MLGAEDGTTVGAIADRLGLESSTVTPPVKRLELAGLVRRQRSQVDERQVQVLLTESGRALIVRSTCLNEALLERSGLTPAQIGTLNRQIRSLREALNGGQTAQS